MKGALRANTDDNESGRCFGGTHRDRPGMRYRDGMLRRFSAWIEETAAARVALPFVSAALLIGGALMIALSLGGSPAAPAPSPTVASARADLEKALAAAQAYLGDQQVPSFEGFNPKSADGVDASLTWNRAETASEGVVTIRVAGERNLLVVSKDAMGVYCIVTNVTGGDTRGTQDAQTSAECTGGW